MTDTHGRGRRREELLARVAAAQHGAFTRRQAMEAGFSARMIGLRVADGRWICVGRGVYRMRSALPTWSLAVSAACLAGTAVASHRAAARLWHFPGFDDALPEVTAYRHRRRHRPDGAIWHESWFMNEARDTTWLDQIQVTSATRTIVDLSTVASVEAIEIALDNARHRGLTDAARVGAELERMKRPFGTKRIRDVLDLKTVSDAPAESPLETRAAIVLRSSGLPKATPQYSIFDEGEFIARVDLAWPEHLVVLEIDGFSVHGDRAAWDRDQERSSKLAAAGWRVHRITHTHTRLADPAAVIAEVRKSLVRTPSTA